MNINIETNFIGNNDTPNSYSGESGKFVVVKTDESGLEFISVQENTDFIYTLDLMNNLSFEMYAPYDFKINEIENIVNTPTITLLVNSIPYTIGSNIIKGSKIEISSNISSVVNLKNTKL